MGPSRPTFRRRSLSEIRTIHRAGAYRGGGASPTPIFISESGDCPLHGSFLGLQRHFRHPHGPKGVFSSSLPEALSGLEEDGEKALSTGAPGGIILSRSSATGSPQGLFLLHMDVGAVGRWCGPRSSKPVSGRGTARGGFDSHPLPSEGKAGTPGIPTFILEAEDHARGPHPPVRWS